MVEALVALVVISVGMLGIAGLYLSSLQAGRSANIRVQALNLASDLGDRIRANRQAKVAYTMAAGGTGVPHSCLTPTACTPVFVAENDLFVWANAVKAALPVGATGAVTYTDTIDLADPKQPHYDRYTIVITWREPGSDAVGNYTMELKL
jgi:type IV pilus assembly protein PilV